MSRMSRRAPLALIALALAACGSGEAAAPLSPVATVGDVGQLPATFPTAPTGPSAAAPESTDTTATTTDELPTTTDEPPSTSPTPDRDAAAAAQPVGRLVDGNRVLIIGDSILASTSRRYGNDMCERLVPLGWAVEVDAETGQQIGFGLDVLGQRLRSGWDTAVIMLGNNYGGQPQPYADELERILDQLAPRPVVLLTVTEFREDRAEVNYVIRSMAAQRDNVRVVEWGDRTRDAEELLGADGLHLSNAGRAELAAMTSLALGRAPSGSRGECLPTRYTNDSAGPADGSS